jgi:choline kinase
MKAIIVAAGLGSRLLPATEHVPKCLVKVNDVPIIDYQFETLIDNNIKDVTIVTGHFGDQIEKYVTEKYGEQFTLKFIENTDYKDTQNAYSLFLGRDILEESADGFIILNSDLVFSSNFLKQLIDSPKPDGMIVDKYTTLESDMVKIRLRGEDEIVEMSKALDQEIATYEAVGPVKFSQAGGKKYFAYLEELFEKEGPKNWLFYTLGDFGETFPFRAIENQGIAWAEIDTLEDLKIAEEVSAELSAKIKRNDATPNT